MVISLLGTGSDTLTSAFDEAGIAYEMRLPAPGQVLNSGVWIEIVQASAQWAAIATVLRAWIRARASRKVLITLEDHSIFHAEGLSLEEIERLLPLAKSVSAMETKKPDKKKK